MPSDAETTELSQECDAKIVLSNGVEFNRAEERLREYCEIEVYSDRNYVGGYDDRHNVTDSISKEDIEAANNLYAMIHQLDSRRILGNPQIPSLLAAVSDSELGDIADEEWEKVKALVLPLLSAFISIPNVKLAKAMKILHLKRPHLLPILDSFVVKFLTGNDLANNPFSEDEILRIGMDSLEIARKDIVSNRAAFACLVKRLSDLPTPLTVVRMYDVLCWTQEKWVNRGETSAPYGARVASKSLDQSALPGEHLKIDAETTREGPSGQLAKQPPAGEIRTTKEFRQIKLRNEGVIVNTASAPPRAHRPLCEELTEERFQTTVILNEGKGGRYYFRNNLAEAVRDLGAVACKKCKPERPISPR
jgi:hypothetical protein